MSDSSASTKIIREISLLYELSLSVGQSLDLRTNCDAFVRTLLARKNLAYGAVWIKDELLLGDGGGEEATCVYANPEFRAKERHLSLRHPLFARIADAAAFSVGSASPDFVDLLAERDVSHGAFAVFALGDLGVLKLLSLASDEPWPASELNQLRNVISKFAVSLEGCLAHQRLMDEVSERQQAEQALRENEERFRAIYEGSNDAIILLTPEGFIDCNSHTLEMFGFESKDEFTRVHLAEISPPTQPDGNVSFPSAQGHIQTAYQQGYDRFEWVHRRTNGEDFPAEVLLSAFQVGDETILQATVRDISERKRAEEMLRRRARQVEVGAAIAQEIAALAASDVLFRRVVDLIRDELGYSYAHIFGYDPVAEEMVLLEGYGKAGERMKADRLRLPYGRGVVGTAAVTRESVLVPDVAAFPGFIAHPDLPDTRCELAVPILLDEGLLGVLDVQSDTVNALTQEDELVLVGLANQVANAVRNGRLLQRAQAALDEVEAANRRYLRERWVDFVPKRAASAYEYVQGEGMPPGSKVDARWLSDLLSATQLVELEEAVERVMTAQETVTVTGAHGGTEQAALVAPVRLRGEVIGALGFRTPLGERQWTSEDIALVQAVADQMALAIENARLLDDTQRGEARERTISEITANLARSLDVEAVLQTVVRELGQTLPVDEVSVWIGAQDQSIPEQPGEVNR
jgi:PAS domain S-box-containing protein